MPHGYLAEMPGSGPPVMACASCTPASKRSLTIRNQAPPSNSYPSHARWTCFSVCPGPGCVCDVFQREPGAGLCAWVVPACRACVAGMWFTCFRGVSGVFHPGGTASSRLAPVCTTLCCALLAVQGSVRTPSLEAPAFTGHRGDGVGSGQWAATCLATLHVLNQVGRGACPNETAAFTAYLQWILVKWRCTLVDTGKARY